MNWVFKRIGRIDHCIKFIIYFKFIRFCEVLEKVDRFSRENCANYLSCDTSESVDCRKKEIEKTWFMCGANPHPHNRRSFYFLLFHPFSP